MTLDSAARVRSVRVDGVEAGWTPVGSTSAGPPLSHYRTPGLAVDPAGRRALVAGGSTLAAVDLRTFRVRASPLRARRLADGGFSSGTYRRALWLRGDTVAVTGWNHRVIGVGLGELPSAGGYYGAADSYRRHLVLAFDLRDGRRVRDAWVPGAMTLLTDATPRVCWR